jgi:hypothetical protein
MPVRKRKNRRRAAAGLDAWECVFSSEFDFFGELEDAGIATDEYGRPDREEARAVWKRYGAEFMAGFTDSHIPWALQQFGEPCR